MSKHKIDIDQSKFKIKSRSILGTPQVPSIIKFLVLKKIIKKEKYAVMFVFTTIFLLMSASVFLVKKSITVPEATINPSLVLGNN